MYTSKAQVMSNRHHMQKHCLTARTAGALNCAWPVLTVMLPTAENSMYVSVADALKKALLVAIFSVA